MTCAASAPKSTHRQQPGDGTSESAGTETSTDILADLARLGETRSWAAGATVVTEGDLADHLYLIHEGGLRACMAGNGARVVELDPLRAGELFGQLTLSGDRSAATVQVTTRTRLTRVKRAEAERALAIDDKGQRVGPGPLSQQRMAEHVGVSKAMVNRLLNDLAQGGCIEVSRERVVLLKKLPLRW